MNKPPERLRIVNVNGIPVVSASCAVLEGWSEHFYTLEKPMKITATTTASPETPVSYHKVAEKTENLTTEEAWAAMARGECVKSGSGTVRRINRIAIEYYEEVNAQWLGCDSIGMAPYSIVPDPSKPKEVEESEYEKDKEFLTGGTNTVWQDFLLTYLDKHFVRKL